MDFAELLAALVVAGMAGGLWYEVRVGRMSSDIDLLRHRLDTAELKLNEVEIEWEGLTQVRERLAKLESK